MCPVLSLEAAETEEKLANGSVVVTEVTRHLLTPLTANATHRRWGFCVPQGIGAGALEGLVAGNGWQEYLFQEAGHIAALTSAPVLVASLLLCAILTALLWVVLLKQFTEVLLRVQFLLSGVAFTASGLLLLTRALVAASRSSGRVAALLKATTPKLQGAAEGVDQLFSTGLEAVQLQGLISDHLGFVGPTTQGCIGLLLAATGMGVLIWYTFSRRMIAVAADCSHEACKVAFRSPSLALLPLLEGVLYISVLLETLYSLAMLLSTADAKPKDIEIFSHRIAGIHRSIVWDYELVLQSLCWIFALLWLSELVTALRSFVLSKVAVTWYFGPASGRHCFRLPILDGTVTALTYHLGSLALGAFVMACLRAFHWFFMALHKVVGEKQKENRCLRCCFGCFEFLISMARGLARHLSTNAYTDLAITSSSWLTASHEAAEVMVKGAGLLAIRSMFLRPVVFIGNLAYAAAFSWGAWVLLDKFDDGDYLATKLPEVLATERAVLGSPAALAVLAGIVAFVVVRAFTAIVDDIADAVLYCYLWDRSDGSVDAPAVPSSFKDLVGTMAVPQTGKR